MAGTSISKLNVGLVLETTQFVDGFARANESVEKFAAKVRRMKKEAESTRLEDMSRKIVGESPFIDGAKVIDPAAEKLKKLNAVMAMSPTLAAPIAKYTSILESITTIGPRATYGLLAFDAAVKAVAIGATAAAIAIGATVYQLGRAAERVGVFVEQSQRLGASVATIQQLELTARTTGTNVDTLAKAMLTMGKNLGSGGMPLDKRFEQVAKQIAAIKDPAERAKLATEVFGKAGVELLPLLRNADALGESARFIDRFGLALSDLQAGSVQKLGDEFTKLRFLAEGFWNRGIIAAAPAALAVFDKLFTSLERMAGAMERVGVTAQGLEDYFIGVGAVVASVLDSLTGMTNVLAGNIEMFKALGQASLFNFEAALEHQKNASAMLSSGYADIARASSGASAFDFIKDAVARSESIRNGASSPFGGTDAGFGAVATKAPSALERGSVGAVRAIQAAGGDPISALPPLLREAVRLLKSIDNNGDPMRAAADGRSVVLMEGAI